MDRVARLPRLAVVVGLSLACLGLWPTAAHAQTNQGVIRFGDGYTVKTGETVDGAVVLLGGNLVVEEGGTVTGDADVVFGNADVNGTIEGALTVVGDITLGPSAQVRDVSVTGNLDRDPSAQVTGRVAQNGGTLTPLDETYQTARGTVGSPFGSIVARTGGILAETLFFMLFAGLVVLVAPRAVGRMRLTMGRRKWASFGVGCLAWILLVPLSIVLIITIVGTPILWAGYGVALLMGWSALALALGSRLARSAHPVTATVLGAALLGLIFGVVGGILGGPAGFLLSCITSLVWLFLACAPLGAGILTVFGSRPWPAGNEVAPHTGPAGPAPAEVAGAGLLAAETAPPAETPDASVEAAGAAAAAGRAAPGEASSDVTSSQEPPVWSSPAAELPTDLEETGGQAPVEAAPPEVPEAAEPPAPEAGAPAPAAPPAPEVGAAGPGRWAAVGDVPGISPIYALLLQEAGIHTVADLAAADPAHVAAVVSTPGVVPVTPETAASWVASAGQMLGG